VPAPLTEPLKPPNPNHNPIQAPASTHRHAPWYDINVRPKAKNQKKKTKTGVDRAGNSKRHTIHACANARVKWPVL